jgi:hypothetical protein
MRTARLIRPLAPALAVAAIAIAGLGATGAADAAPVAETTSAADTPTTVEIQRGLVLEGYGDGVMVTVYENSRYGNSLQVVLGDPDEGGHIGYAEQSAPYVVDGVLTATVEIDGFPATLSGTVTPTGRPEQLVEPMQDAGEQLVTRGTHTQLLTDVVLAYRGTVVPIAFAPAFAYDLEVRRTTLYGN